MNNESNGDNPKVAYWPFLEVQGRDFSKSKKQRRREAAITRK